MLQHFVKQLKQIRTCFRTWKKKKKKIRKWHHRDCLLSPKSTAALRSQMNCIFFFFFYTLLTCCCGCALDCVLALWSLAGVENLFFPQGECCNTFFLWNSRNILRTMKLHLIFHPQVTFFIFGWTCPLNTWSEYFFQRCLPPTQHSQYHK